jgi:hypothetical protein
MSTMRFLSAAAAAALQPLATIVGADACLPVRARGVRARTAGSARGRGGRSMLMATIFALAALLVVPTAAGAQLVDPSDCWAGSLTFDESNLDTKNVPLNVTIHQPPRPKTISRPHTEGGGAAGQSTASFKWYFTRDGPAGTCRGQLEPALAWSIDKRSGRVTAQGTGVDPNFYSFVGMLDDATNTINGTIFHPPFPAKKLPCGSFTIRPVSATNLPKPPQCQAHQPKTWPAMISGAIHSMDPHPVISAVCFASSSDLSLDSPKSVILMSSHSSEAELRFGGVSSRRLGDFRSQWMIAWSQLSSFSPAASTPPLPLPSFLSNAVCTVCDTWP